MMMLASTKGREMFNKKLINATYDSKKVEIVSKKARLTIPPRVSQKPGLHVSDNDTVISIENITCILSFQAEGKQSYLLLI